MDVGAGGGLPSIPCLIARPDLRALLVESSKKKAVFLREALRALGLDERTEVIAERFEGLQHPEADCLTCRALDRFSDVFQGLLKWSELIETLLLFGGVS
ncbi:MAG: class I SAM-dependent methyltransferase, partial [Acidobacteriota bacterium]|nr:class I SAM-dependent methyltransferase [Acidobacteriota bacterium]